MAKKPKVNKTEAVREYLKAHPGAMSKEIAAALNKQGIKINPGHVANIKTKINKEAAPKKRTAKKVAKKAAVVVAAPTVVVEKPTMNGGAITLDQVKKVAHTIQMVGGLPRVLETLEVIKELGGVKKFKELAEAMTVTAPVTDEIPF